jgi:hypothetical protein
METQNAHSILEWLGLTFVVLVITRLFGEAVFWYSVNRAKGEMLLEAAAKAAKGEATR